MQPSSLLLLPIVFVLSFSSVSVIISGQNVKCYDVGNFTANSNFKTTLDGILDSIATTTSSTMTYGLFNASTSQQHNTEAVEVIGYCHGDLNGDACRACLNASAYEIRLQCPVQKKALFYAVNCTLKYSNGSLYGILDMTPGFIWLSENKQSNWDTFAKGLSKLLDDLRGQASSGGTLRKYAQGTAPSVDQETLYATVQCSPDLSDQQCSDCLVNITGMIPKGRIGARMLWPSCQLRYEISRFFDPVAVPVGEPTASEGSTGAPSTVPSTPSIAQPPSPTDSSKEKSGVSSTSSSIIMGQIIGLVLFACIGLFLF